MKTTNILRIVGVLAFTLGIIGGFTHIITSDQHFQLNVYGLLFTIWGEVLALSEQR